MKHFWMRFAGACVRATLFPVCLENLSSLYSHVQKFVNIHSELTFAYTTDHFVQKTGYFELFCSKCVAVNTSARQRAFVYNRCRSFEISKVKAEQTPEQRYVILCVIHNVAVVC